MILLLVFINVFILECVAEVSLSVENNTVIVYPGNSATIKCNGSNLLTNDIVWQYSPIGNQSINSVIFINGRLINEFQTKYLVKSYQSSPTQVLTSLTIANVDATDAAFEYQCVCNIYSACATGYKAKVDAYLNVMPPTTTTTTTTTSNFNLWLLFLLNGLKFSNSY